jgi:diguanylate cyclase (GGDEF)-like protein/PAS domain S-box-containing protein
MSPSNKQVRLEQALAEERSAREQAEGLLDEQAREFWREREQYRVMAENASDIVVQLGSNGMIDWVSPSVHRILGYEPASLVGTALRGIVHTDDVEALTSAVVAAMSTDDQHPAFEVRLRQSDGRHVWMSVRLQRAVANHLVVSLREAESQVREREAREASEARYRLLAENATDVVFLTGLDGLVTWISPNVERVLGWEPDQLIGTDMADLRHPDDDDTPVRLRTASGAYRWMLSKTTTVQDGDGVHIGAVTGLREVDELIRERERAELHRAVLQATLDSLVDPHVVLSAVRDDSGQLVDFTFSDANEAAVEYNGVPRHELIGMRLTHLLPGHTGSELLARYVHTVESGETLVLDDYPYEDEIHGGIRYFDTRAVRIGENLSYTWRDVTERHRAQEALARSESQYRLLAENSSDIVVRLSPVGTVLWASPSITEALGWDPDEWLGKTPDDFAHPDDLESLRLAREGLRSGTLPLSHGVWVTRFRVLAKDGAYHWIETHTRDFTNDEGRRDGVVVSFRVIDVEVEVEEQLDRRARYDDLTGALKRDEAMDRLSSIGRRLRQPGNESAVLFIDVDGFKSVNDTVGHAAGDVLLSTYVNRWRTVVRASDSVARTGGDEFVVILDGIHDVAEGVAVAEKMRIAATEPVVTAFGTVQATVSIGVTLVQPVETSDAMIARADAAMYRAKQGGRNRVSALTTSG